MNAYDGADTGRLTTTLAPEAQQIVYDEYVRPAPAAGSAVAAELAWISEVDRAHLVMLAERGIVGAEPARRLLTEIEQLRRADFAPVTGLPVPRGVYLSYEGYLIQRTDDTVGGVLHTGRSRNDLNATTARLRTREPYRRLLAAVAECAQVLLDRADAYRDVTMPAYTHGQPAVPITYGHYLSALAAAMIRGLDDLLHAGDELDVNPLGAGAVGGTTVPIDTRRTTELLGFTEPALNSVDAVASRDFALRLLAAVTVLACTVQRAARDLSTWTSEESGLLRLSDDLVGSSSMMPQKRNPFLLEHISGRAAVPLGALTGAFTAMATAGYTNAIAVGTEAMRQLAPGLDAANDAVTLLRLVVAGAQPQADRMMRRCTDGFTTATYLAERLVADGVPFRTAHHQVGRAVRDALTDGTPLPGDAADPAQVARRCAFGGGPGTDAGPELRRRLAYRRAEALRRQERWQAAAADLDDAVAVMLARRELTTGRRQQ